MDRVVNIYADGKLAYTGILELAARRLNMRPDVLEDLLDDGPTDFRGAQPRSIEVGEWTIPIKRARKYVAQWRACVPFWPPTVASYLHGVDAHLATIATAEERADVLEQELRLADRAGCALEKWAAKGCGRRPIHFDAHELLTITLELSKRLADARLEIRDAARAAAE